MTYLFDLDNTLLDEDNARQSYLIQVFNEYRPLIPMLSFDEFNNRWAQVIEKYFDLYIAGRLSFHEQRQHRIKDAFELSAHNLPIIDEIITKFDAYYQNAWRCFNDVVPTLISLKKKEAKIGLITNGESSQQRAKITKTGIICYFDAIIISSEFGCSKPSKEIFDIACDKLCVHANDCYFIGDRIDLDVEGSYNAGMHPVWINRKNESKIVPPSTIVISTLTEIPGT